MYFKSSFNPFTQIPLILTPCITIEQQGNCITLQISISSIIFYYTAYFIHILAFSVRFKVKELIFGIVLNFDSAGVYHADFYMLEREEQTQNNFCHIPYM